MAQGECKGTGIDLGKVGTWFPRGRGSCRGLNLQLLAVCRIRDNGSAVICARCSGGFHESDKLRGGNQFTGPRFDGGSAGLVRRTTSRHVGTRGIGSVG